MLDLVRRGQWTRDEVGSIARTIPITGRRRLSIRSKCDVGLANHPEQAESFEAAWWSRRIADDSFGSTGRSIFSATRIAATVLHSDGVSITSRTTGTRCGERHHDSQSTLRPPA